MDKSAKKHTNKKNELVEIAEKLFIEKGYEETSVEDILKASGLSKGGFYHYFKSKEEVLSESINNLMENFLNELEPMIQNVELNALEKLRLLMGKQSDLQNYRRKYARGLGMAIKSEFMLYKFYLSLSQKYVDPLTRIIEQGVKEGIFNVQFPRETADILLRAVTTVPQSMFFADYINDKTISANYKSSLREVIARALGIDSRELLQVDDNLNKKED